LLGSALALGSCRRSAAWVFCEPRDLRSGRSWIGHQGVVGGRTDIDWVRFGVILVVTGVAVAFVPWAMDFGWDGGRWWLTAVILVAVVAVEAAAVFAVLRLRRSRALGK
jgi:hypothetical protein